MWRFRSVGTLFLLSFVGCARPSPPSLPSPSPPPCDLVFNPEKRTGCFVFADTVASQESRVPVWYFLPSDFGPESNILFVMHGHRRHADTYRDDWILKAESKHVVLLAPLFSENDYPNPSGYPWGNVVNSDGEPNESELWTFKVLERLFDRFREMTGNRTSEYFLYGHSAGAQFIHRMILFLPNARIHSAVAANAGWYVLPSFSQCFPYGLSHSPATPELLKEALQRPLTILAGDEDVDAEDPLLRNTRKARAQGKNRLERARTFIRKSKRTALKLSVPFKWNFEIVPGAAHSNKQMIERAARVFFSDED